MLIGVWVAMGGLVAGYGALIIVNWDTPARDSIDRVTLPPVLVAFSICAGIVSWQRRRNPIGWLLWVAAFAMGAYAASYEYAIRAVIGEPGSLPAGELAAWLHVWVWVPMLALFMPGLALFPGGALLSRRWRPIVGLSLAAIVVFTVGSATAPGPLLDEEYVENPYAVKAVSHGELATVLALVVLLCANAAAPILRFQRSGPVERQQLKWLALSGVALTGAFPLLIIADPFPVTRDLSSVVFFAVLLGFPTSITIAIVRHRLYDIDLLINRALVYGSLTAATVGSYLVLVLGFGWLARNVIGQGSNEIAVAATTLIVAAIFQPARRRIQSVVDRRFYRAHYNAEQTLGAFQSRLRNETDIESLRAELGATVQAALQPRAVGIWLRPGSPVRNDLVSAPAYRNERTEQHR